MNTLPQQAAAPTLENEAGGPARAGAAASTGVGDRFICFFLLAAACVISAMEVIFSTHRQPVMSALVIVVSLAGVFGGGSKKQWITTLTAGAFLLPFFRTGALLFLCSTLAFRRFVVRPVVVFSTVGTAAMCVLGVALIHTLVADIDFDLLRSALAGGGAVGVANYLILSAPRWFVALHTFLSVGVALVLFRLAGEGFRGHDGMKQLRLGAAFGAAVCSLVAVAQHLFPDSVAAWNVGQFWRDLGRVAGSLSDPNALGVVAALVAPLLFLGTKRDRAAAIALVYAGFLSGSRTFLVGVGVFAFFMLWRAQRGAAFLLAACVMLFAALLAAAPQTAIDNLPLSLQRAAATIRPGSSEEMLSSRSIYTRLALDVIAYAPLTGVGLERFYEEQGAAARRLGIRLAGWRDNANNFYLHLLAELGLVCGTLLIALGIFTFVRSSCAGGDPVARAALVALAVMLLTGPHLLFDEVKVIGALFLAAATSFAPPKRFGGVARVATFSVIAFACGAVLRTAERPQSTGLYDVERAEGRRVRWSSQQGIISLCRNSKSGGALKVRALHPDIREAPVEVTFRSDLGDQSLRLKDSEWHTVQWTGEKPLRDISFEVSRTWSPLSLGKSLDARQLGVLVRWPADACD